MRLALGGGGEDVRLEGTADPVQIFLIGKKVIRRQKAGGGRPEKVAQELRCAEGVLTEAPSRPLLIFARNNNATMRMC